MSSQHQPAWAVTFLPGHSPSSHGSDGETSRVIEKLLLTPFPIFWTAVLFLGFFLFTDTYVKWYRWTAGTMHAVSHIAATFFIGWGASYVAITIVGLRCQTPAQLL